MAQMFSKDDLYVSPQGNDQWSGRLAVPNAEGTDGPLATIAGARDVVRRRKEAGELAGPVTVWLRGTWYFRELFVNGQRRRRPRHSSCVIRLAY